MGEQQLCTRRTDRAVVVTGLGVQSPAGCEIETFWTNLTRQRVATKVVPELQLGEYPIVAGVVDDGFRTLGRCQQLAVAAARSAANHAGLDAATLGEQAPRVAVVMGTVVGGRQVLDAHIGNYLREPVRGLWDATDWTLSRAESVGVAVARELQAMGPNYTLTMACAAGNAAIGLGARLIASGEADIVFAGGADELSPAFLAMFMQHGALSPDYIRPFSIGRRGVLLSEGAALVVLESERSAARRGRSPLARVAGYHSCADAYDVMAPHPEGRGAVVSMTRALTRAGLGPQAVDLISAHGTGTPANDKSEAAAIQQVFSANPNVLVTAPKAMLGHCQGAAGAVETVASILSLNRGLALGTPNNIGMDPEARVSLLTENRAMPLGVVLSNAFGFGGNVSSLVLTGANA